VLPNPITQSSEIGDESLNDFNIKFVIGNENCAAVVLTVEKQFCNGELLPGRFALIARVFTDNGFRDTEPVIFDVDLSVSDLLSAKTMAVIFMAFIILLSLITAVCCCMSHRRKQKILKKKKEAAEADENLLSFTSYCVIDRHPKPKIYDG
jgi:hypothetical protein